jgi:hypothetical protein
VAGRRGDHLGRGIPADLGQEAWLQAGGEHVSGTPGHWAAQRPGAPGTTVKPLPGSGRGRGHYGTTVAGRGLGTLSMASLSRAGEGCT